MPSNNFDKLYKQVRKQITDQTTEKVDLQPYFVPTRASAFGTRDTTKRANTNPSFQWYTIESSSYLSGTFAINDFVLSPEIFDTLDLERIEYLWDSQEGNLTYSDLQPYKIYSFSADLYRSTADAVSAGFNLTWSGPIDIRMNGTALVASNFNIRNNVVFPMESGRNRISVTIRTTDSTPSYFALNSTIGELIDRWSIPPWGAPEVPTGLVVETNDASIVTVNNLANTVDWDTNSDPYTKRYSIYRSGPHSILDSPMGSANESPIDVFFSGELAQRQTYSYAVAYHDGIHESKPSFTSTVTTPAIDPSLTYFICSGLDSPVGDLSGIEYHHWTMTAYTTGVSEGRKETTRLGTCSGILYPKTSARLSWLWVPQTWADPWGFYPSGFRVYRDTSGVFNESSLIADVPSFPNLGIFNSGDMPYGIQTGVVFDDAFGYTLEYLSSYSIIDTGVTPQAYTPPEQSQVHSGISLYMSWELPTDISDLSSISGYNIYRSTTHNFNQDSFIGSVTGVYTTGFLDSGISPQPGRPTNYISIGDVNHPVSIYEDLSVLHNARYYYKVAALTETLNASNFSNEVTIIAGDQTPPAPPTGIGAWQNGIYWINGSEPDLDGTEVWMARTDVGDPFPTDDMFWQRDFVKADTTPGQLDANWTFTLSPGSTQYNRYYFKVRNRDTNGNVSDFG